MSALAFGTTIPFSWDPRSLLPPQEEACVPVQGGGEVQGEILSFEALLSFVKTKPHCIYPWGSDHMEEPGLAQQQNPPGAHPDLRRFWHVLFAPPSGPMHELRSVTCHTVAGHSSIPDFGGEVLLMTEHMLPFPVQCRPQPAQAEVGGGWHGKM